MNISASFNIPIMTLIEVEDSDVRAAKAAGIAIPKNLDDDYDIAYEFADWLMKYWCSKASAYAIHDIIRDSECERDLPELIQIDSIDGAP